MVQWKENSFSALHKIMETGELFVVYRECDEDRSSSKRRVREAHGRARVAKTL